MDAANRWTGNKIVFNYCLSNTQLLYVAQYIGKTTFDVAV